MLLSQSGLMDVRGTPDAQTGKDHRWARRANCRIAAEISHHTLSQTMACVVRDTSSSGARVELTGARNAFSAGTERIPDHIKLTMPMDRVEVDCRVTWRKGTMIGVRYLSPSRPLPKRVPARLGQPKPKDNGLIGKFFR